MSGATLISKSLVARVDAPEALTDHRHCLAWLTPDGDTHLAEILPTFHPPLCQRPAIFTVIICKLLIDLVEWCGHNLSHFDDTYGCFRTVSHNGIVTDLRGLNAFVLQFPKQGARRRLNSFAGKSSDRAGRYTGDASGSSRVE